MEIVVSVWILIALIIFPFFIGFLTAVKVMKMRFALHLIKKLPPKEFEKLLDDYESQRISPIND